jgi:hypothetical protein
MASFLQFRSAASTHATDAAACYRSWTETVAREHCQDAGAQSDCSAMHIQRFAAWLRVQLKAHICAQLKEAVYRVNRPMVIWGLLETVSFATNIFFISSWYIPCSSWAYLHIQLNVLALYLTMRLFFAWGVAIWIDVCNLWFLTFQFIPDQGWTSGYSQNGSAGVTSAYGGGGQMHGGDDAIYAISQ